MNIAAIVVLYNPTQGDIRNVKTLSTFDVNLIVVVNNTTRESLDCFSPTPDFDLLINKTNLGLSTALNQGISKAFEKKNIEYVLLLDQDSILTIESVNELKLSLELATKNNCNPGCIGPRLVDKKNNSSAIKFTPNNNFGYTLTNTIATSGMLIPKFVLQKVGGMREELCIDGIDHEWCFRAKSMGFNILISDNVSMQHDMGESGISLFGRYRPLYQSPTRHYYIIRNHLYLLKKKYIPVRWRIRELLKTLYRLVIYIIISNNRPLSASLATRAIKDAYCSRMGSIKE